MFVRRSPLFRREAQTRAQPRPIILKRKRAAMQPRARIDDGKPKPDPLRSLRPNLLESLHRVSPVFGRDTWPIVSHDYFGAVAMRIETNIHRALSVFDRVVDKIGDGLHEQRAMTADGDRLCFKAKGQSLLLR